MRINDHLVIKIHYVYHILIKSHKWELLKNELFPYICSFEMIIKKVLVKTKWI